MTVEHIKLLHRAAQGLDGKLVLTSYGEDPATGKAIQPKVEQFSIGDWQGMSERALQWKAEPHRNVYAPLGLVKHGVNSRGKASDYSHVFGVVADFDDDNAADYMNRLPIPPCLVLESSQGRFQCHYLFNRPVATDEAKEIGKRLVAYSECDGCSSDPIHVWRVAGCLNWPNKKKVGEGRPAEPQLVSVAQAWCCKAINPDELLEALPPVEEEKKPAQATTRPLIGDYPPTTRADVEEALTYIPADLPYDEWLKILAALKDAGFDDLAHEWSAKSPQYDPAEVERKLASFNGNGVTLKTVFHYAKQGGYKNTLSDYKPSDKTDKRSWEAPVPMPSALSPVDVFDTHLLPDVFRRFADDVADRTQCPVEYVAVALMSSLGGVVGKSVSIYPKQFDNWQVVPNLWGALVGRPSAMKSPPMTAAMSGVSALIKEARQDYANDMETFAIEQKVHKAKDKALDAEISKLVKAGKGVESLSLPEKPQPPTERRFVTNAGSVERLIALLEQNPDGIIQSRDELTGWLRSMDNTASQDARAFYIESWNGAGSSFSYDTVAHGHLFCETGPCLSVIGTIQPGPLSAVIAGAESGGTGDDGLLQRFQLMVLPDGAMNWEYRDRQPDRDALTAMQDVFKVASSMVGELRFATDAQPVFIEWYTDLMHRMKSEEHPGIESHLSKYPQLMPALALLIHLAEYASQPEWKRDELPPVSKESAIKAVGWCVFLESHARRIYALGKNAGVSAAMKVVKMVIDGKLKSPFTARDVYRRQLSGMSKTEPVNHSIDLLEIYGWVKVEIVQTGGRPSTVYHMHPEAEKYLKRCVTPTDKTDKSPLNTLLTPFVSAPQTHIQKNKTIEYDEVSI